MSAPTLPTGKCGAALGWGEGHRALGGTGQHRCTYPAGRTTVQGAGTGGIAWGMLSGSICP